MSNALDRLAIRELVEHWAIWRDARMWDKFRSVWHDGGEMWATWFQGSAEEFIRVSQEGYSRGVRVLHSLSGMAVNIEDNRAIAQTKTTITQRGTIDGVPCDVVCMGRTYDFIEKRPVDNGHEGWGIVLRRLIYEMDRLEVLDQKTTLKLAPALLEQFPIGYRHLAYLQTKGGLNVRRDLPGLEGPELDALYARGAEWLAGKAI